jgi:hypothetical protein
VLARIPAQRARRQRRGRTRGYEAQFKRPQITRRFCSAAHPIYLRLSDIRARKSVERPRALTNASERTRCWPLKKPASNCRLCHRS